MTLAGRGPGGRSGLAIPLVATGAAVRGIGSVPDPVWLPVPVTVRLGGMPSVRRTSVVPAAPKLDELAFASGLGGIMVLVPVVIGTEVCVE